MQRKGLHPAHPSLPATPVSYTQSTTASLPQATSAAYALNAALTNPYGYPSYAQQQSAYSSHYAQAYLQSAVKTTPHGYTLSSTYDPWAAGRFASSGQSGFENPTVPSFRPVHSTHSTPQWFQPGNNRCTYQDCTFTGSHKSVETHMMDRHLIFPPGWDKRKQKSDWDADPSLKGCLAIYLIQMTSIHLFAENPSQFKGRPLF